MDLCPRFKSHLLPHHELLAARHTAKKDKPQNWHKTIDRVNLGLLKKPKLYIADIKDRLLPALDLGKTYPQHNLYWITSETWDLRVLGALLMPAVGEFFIHCYGVRMRGGYLRFQAQYLRRIRVPDPTKISPKLADTLRQAFDTQDFALATKAALEAYGLTHLTKAQSTTRGAIPAPVTFSTDFCSPSKCDINEASPRSVTSFRRSSVQELLD